MSERGHAYLELVRIPNVFTAQADVIAGFLYAGGGLEDWPILALIAAAAACLYGGGAALNDVCDRERDAQRCPHRPIPSGRVSRKAALRLASGLLVVGFILAAITRPDSGVVAAALVGAIVLYDKPLKETRLAPALMGLCRALNLTLGLSGAGALGLMESTSLLSMIVPVALIWLYVTSVTYFARYESAGSRPGGAGAAAAGVCLAAGGLVSLLWILPQRYETYLAPVTVLVLILAHRGLTAVRRCCDQAVQRAVRTFVLVIPLFDACFVWAERGPGVALIVAVTLLPALVLARTFRVT